MADSNGVMLQYFHWDLPADGSLWNELARDAAELSRAGFTSLWLPPCNKGADGPTDRGYRPYDLFDLGEFDQKGSVRTKYGTREKLLDAIRIAQGAGLQVYADVVFNHKDGGEDPPESLWAQPMRWSARNEALGDWEKIHAYTQFAFPARGGRYSRFVWSWWCFDSLSYNADTRSAGCLYRLKGKQFETGVSHEHGNYDYLLANDIDTSDPFVIGELKYWGEWFLETTGVDGFRIDAAKHIRSSWFPDWLGHLRGKYGRELFSVGEYWSERVEDLHDYLSRSAGVMALFDVPLHFNFQRASCCGAAFDLRTLLDRTLMKEQPGKAVTFVENHDTVPCQSLMSPVEPWFKPLAYAVILLRREGYPCVFHADYYGAEYDNCLGGYPPVKLYSHRLLIDRFLKARREYNYGDQHDYFDHPNTIGWMRLGTSEHPGAMAVVLSNGSAGTKWMNTFRPRATFYDVTGHIREKVTANGDGWAEFRCPAGSVSVWLQE